MKQGKHRDPKTGKIVKGGRDLDNGIRFEAKLAKRLKRRPGEKAGRKAARKARHK